ncbi:AAA family ATPase [Chloroflexi bacterium TSY]|nr:AAA family ATPase [Chloroflexi bacterium TSY]
MDGNLRLVLLGNPEIRQDDISVTSSMSSKALALLCYLAMTECSHARATLATLLWGDMPEATARTNLRKALAHLRRSVGAHLKITRQAVAFNQENAYWLDVADFEAKVGDASATADIQLLQEAVELYRGDFLEGFYVRNAPGFETWSLTERARLRESALRALHTLASHHAQQGDPIQAIDYTRRLLALEPWWEEAHRQLMLLLVLNGQRGAALAQYETCCQVLDKEFAVQPDKETTTLYHRIRNGEITSSIDRGESITARPIESTPATNSASLPPFFAHTPSLPNTPIPFVSRDQELAQLKSHLALALTGQGRVVFVHGEAGTGKTALVQEFARRVQEEHNRLVFACGNCNAYVGTGDPYLPFREILGMLTGDVEARWTVGAIHREHAQRLWNLIPQVGPMMVQVGVDLIDIFISGQTFKERTVVAVSDDANWVPQLERVIECKAASRGLVNLKQIDLFEQYTSVLQTLARQVPLLLVLDDLQWADDGSISLLFHLGRRLEGHQILIIGVYRPSDVAQGRGDERHPLESVVNEFQRDFGDIYIDLEQSENQHFVDAWIDSEHNQLGAEFRAALYRHTKGHALFTVEIVRDMKERHDLFQDETGQWIEKPDSNWEALPKRVEGVIRERINRLPPTLLEVLKIACVEGEDFIAEVVARVLAVDEWTVVQQLSAILDKQHQLVRGIDRQSLNDQTLSRYRFRHILFQKYLYNSMDKVERTYLHEAIGKVIERLYEDQTNSMSIQLARHFREAGLGLKAVDYLHIAGEQAIQSCAYQEADRLLTDALTLLGTLPDTAARTQRESRLHIARGNLLVITRGFGSEDARDAYKRTQKLYEQADATPELFPAQWGLWLVSYSQGQHRTARKLGEQLLRWANLIQDSDLLLQAHHALWTSYFSMGEFVLARNHFEQGLSLYNPQRHHAPHHFYGGHDAGVCCRNFGGPTLWFLGYPDQNLQTNLAALSLSRSKFQVLRENSG